MLHGEIKVNDFVIANWSAENTGEQFLGDTVYKCRVWGRDKRGYPYDESFAVGHDPDRGALVLVWGIMQKASLFTTG